MKDGGPAAPIVGLNGDGFYEAISTGMTVRDVFAVAALPALIGVATEYAKVAGKGLSGEDIAKLAYEQADAMLKMREK